MLRSGRGAAVWLRKKGELCLCADSRGFRVANHCAWYGKSSQPSRGLPPRPRHPRDYEAWVARESRRRLTWPGECALRRAFGPVETLVSGKCHLLWCRAGPLTALPFHLLVTEKPAIAGSERLAGYRDAAWLAMRHAVTVLPSVSSLKTLRVLVRADQAAKPMIGFGDPVLDRRIRPRNAPPRASPARAYTDYWRGAGWTERSFRKRFRD